jgi:uncharacterized protein (TIGR03089 family)
MTTTIVQTFAAAVRRDPTTPLLTWYDDASGDRTELSGATLDNWVSKTANLVADGAGLGPGDTAAVSLPPHWQTAAVLLGAWSAGLAVVAGGPGDITFATPELASPGAYVTGLLPLAMPLRTVPDGCLDYVLEVRAFGDHFRATQPVEAKDPAYGDSSHSSLVELARSRAAELGFGAGDRVLIDAAVHPDPVEWLVAPLLAGASIVLCGNLDPAKVSHRVEIEKVTVF